MFVFSGDVWVIFCFQPHAMQIGSHVLVDMSPPKISWVDFKGIAFREFITTQTTKTNRGTFLSKLGQGNRLES